MNFVEGIGWRGNYNRAGPIINFIALITVTFISFDAYTLVTTWFVDAIRILITDVYPRTLIDIDAVYAIIVRIRNVSESILTVALKMKGC